jgi:hypothetical protein
MVTMMMVMMMMVMMLRCFLAKTMLDRKPSVSTNAQTLV